MEIEEGEESKVKGQENIFNKVIEENFLNLKKKMSCHIIIKTLNAQNKEGIIKAIREKGQVTYEGSPIRVTPDFSTETLKSRRSWVDVIQTL